jgi:hypothetical protein
LVYSPANFNKCVQPCTTITTIQKHYFLLLVVNTLSLHSATCNHWSDLFLYGICFPECNINGIKQYVAFWVWFISFSNTYLKFMHIVACINSLHLLLMNYIPLYGQMYQSLFLPSLINAHLGCFHFGVIMNKAAINNCMQIFVWTSISTSLE